MNSLWQPVASAAIFAATVALGIAPAAAQVDFSGKRIEVIVPSAAGGSSDLTARFLMPLIAERLPGSPTLVIRNVEGAGSIAGANQFQDRATPDGTDLMWMPPSALLNYVFRDPRGHYKVNEWTPILTTSQGAMVYGLTSLGIKDASELPKLRGQELIMAANTPTSSDIRVLLPLDLLGLTIKPVFGLNRGEVYPGFERGEFNINFDSYAAYHEQIKPMVERGIAMPLFTLGYADESGTIVRDPSAPDQPHFLELYEQFNGKPLEGPAREAWNAIFNLTIMTTRAVFLPAGTPQDVADAYAQAVEKLASDLQTDPALKEQAVNFMGPEPLTFGENAARTVQAAVTFSDEAFAWLREWLKTKYDVTI